MTDAAIGPEGYVKVTSLRLELSLPAVVTPVEGARFVPGSAVDVLFDVGRYRLNGNRVAASAIDAYHTRSSARWAERADGSWQEFATGIPAILPGRGYDARESRTILNSNPLNPRLWQVDGAGVFTDLPGNFLGFSSATTFAGLGQTFHRARSLIGEGVLMPGEVYAVRALYRAGTSPHARVHVRCVSPAADAKVDGLLGSLTVTANSAGPISQVENIYWGSGLYECRFLYTCTITGTGWSLSIGPDSGVNGQTIGIIAGQITRTAWHVPWGSDAVAADSLVIPAAEAGMAVNPAASGLTMFWRGRDYPSAAGFPRSMEIRIDGSNRLSFERRMSDGVARPAFVGPAGASTALNFGTLAQLPYGTEYTVVATWRPDGSVWLKGGAVAASTGTGRTILAGTPATIGIGNTGAGSDQLNSITRRCGLIPYSLSDADALALFNQINEGL